MNRGAALTAQPAMLAAAVVNTWEDRLATALTYTHVPAGTT